MLARCWSASDRHQPIPAPRSGSAQQAAGSYCADSRLCLRLWSRPSLFPARPPRSLPSPPQGPPPPRPLGPRAHRVARARTRAGAPVAVRRRELPPGFPSASPGFSRLGSKLGFMGIVSADIGGAGKSTTGRRATARARSGGAQRGVRARGSRGPRARMSQGGEAARTAPALSCDHRA